MGETTAISWCDHTHEHEAVRIGKKRGGAELDGREYREFPARS